MTKEGVIPLKQISVVKVNSIMKAIIERRSRMKKFLKILCVSALITCMMAVNVSAARFTFTFNNSGTDCSTPATKRNSSNSASVSVTTAGNYTYQYAVGRGQYTNYITGWVTKTGRGSFSIGYNSKPGVNDSVYLHGRTVNSSGTSSVSGDWTP